MSEVIPVCIPQETVNDDFVLILQWKVADGQAVQSGQILVEVETSKSVFEIISPADGFIRLNAASDQEVPVGKVLCYVGATWEAADSSVKAAETTSAPGSSIVFTSTEATAAETDRAREHRVVSETVAVEPAAEQPAVLVHSFSKDESSATAPPSRFSRQALELIQTHGLSESDFAGRGLVRSEEVLRSLTIARMDAVRPDPALSTLIGHVPPPASPSSKTESQFRSAAGVPFRTEPLARSKRLETRLLSWSTRQAIRSSVTVIVPTAGRHQLQAGDCDAVDKIAANVIHSCAQSLRKFPLLNACCLDDQVMVYEQVHVGYALDAGHGLKVAVLRHADQKAASAIMDERQRLIAAYLNQSLLPADQSGATFTITDLSGSGVATFDPIISEGQAGILGIGGEFAVGGGHRAFQLVLSFDHRLVEGRVAAMFLNHVKEQVIAFEQSLTSSQSQEACCSRCGVTVSGAAKRNHFLVSVAGARNSTSLICTVCLQGR